MQQDSQEPLDALQCLSHISSWAGAAPSAVLSQVNLVTPCNLSTNIELAPDIDVEKLMSRLGRGVTRFNIWRDAYKEVTKEEVTTINKILNMFASNDSRNGMLTKVSMQKVQLHTCIHTDTQIYSNLFFQGTSTCLRMGIAAWREGSFEETEAKEGGGLLAVWTPMASYP